jgi:hypothetical protein
VRRALALCVAACACAPEPEPRRDSYSHADDRPLTPYLLGLERGKGISILRRSGDHLLSGTEGAQTFAISEHGLLITRGDVLERYSVATKQIDLLAKVDGELRFPASHVGGTRIVVSLKARGEGHDKWQLLELPARILGPGYAPSFCPDGTLYYERHEGGPAIWMWSPTAAAPVLVATGAHTASCSPDDRYVVYSRAGALVVLDRASGKERQFTTPGPGGYDRFARFGWSSGVVVWWRANEGRWLVRNLLGKREDEVRRGDFVQLEVDLPRHPFPRAPPRTP